MYAPFFDFGKKSLKIISLSLPTTPLFGYYTSRTFRLKRTSWSSSPKSHWSLWNSQNTIGMRRWVSFCHTHMQIVRYNTRNVITKQHVCVFFFSFFLYETKRKLQEIRDMLNARGLLSSSVTLSPCGSGPNWARAAPVAAESHAEFWEEWKQLCLRDKLDACTIRGHKVSLCPSPTENLLCVARLPRDLLDDEFKELVSSYGPVRRCFLLYSDKTGQSSV